MSAAHLCVDLAFLPQRPTGLGNYALNVIGKLDWLGPVTVFASRPLPPHLQVSVPAALNSDGGRQAHLRRLFWQQTQLPRLCRRLKAELLFSPVPEAPLFAPCPAVVTVHDLIPLRFPGRFPALLSRYFRLYVPRVLERAAHILCDSEATARDLGHFYGLPARKITTVPLAYEAGHFYPRGVKAGNYFLYLGRQDRYKNLERMIAAFARLQASDYEFWIAGPQDPRQRPFLEAQIQRWQLGGRVRFIDYVPYQQLPELIEGAVALVFATLWEGFGLPVLEAMACGTPVITSNLSSLPEVAEGAALLVDPYRVEEIADAMEQLLTVANLRAKLRQLGLERAAQFSWQRTANQTAEILSRFA